MPRMTVLHDDWQYRDEQQRDYEVEKARLKALRDAAQQALYEHDAKDCLDCLTMRSRYTYCKERLGLHDRALEYRDKVRNHCAKGAHYMMAQCEKAGVKIPSHGPRANNARLGELLRGHREF